MHCYLCHCRTTTVCRTPCIITCVMARRPLSNPNPGTTTVCRTPCIITCVMAGRPLSNPNPNPGTTTVCRTPCITTCDMAGAHVKLHFPAPLLQTLPSLVAPLKGHVFRLCPSVDRFCPKYVSPTSEDIQPHIIICRPKSLRQSHAVSALRAVCGEV